MFNSYEELKSQVATRRQSTLTLELDMGSEYSQEHEDAKKALAQAEGMQLITGGAGFLSNNLDELKQRVADTKPEAQSVYVQFKKLDLDEWKDLINSKGLDAFAQYEQVLPKTFMGLYGQDPVRPDDLPAEVVWEKPEPLTTDYHSVSSEGGEERILSGGQLHAIVQNFMTWQNSGGEVTIRPTKSGRA